MSLKTTVETEIKTAMKAKEADRLRALRGIKSAIMLLETSGTGKDITEADEMKLLAKEAKQRRDSAATYQEQGRQDLAEVELSELAIIESFLPKPLTEAEIAQAVDAIIAETSASSMKDMGKVMGLATQQMAGKADPKIISSLVKEKLSQ